MRKPASGQLPEIERGDFIHDFDRLHADPNDLLDQIDDVPLIAVMIGIGCDSTPAVSSDLMLIQTSLFLTLRV